jgi:hypothetical protein
MVEAEQVFMKWTILLILLCGSLVSMCALADDAKGTHSRWVIILTLIDTTSGKLVSGATSTRNWNLTTQADAGQSWRESIQYPRAETLPSR